MNSGFREIEHTADWELEVWAPNLAELFSQAAKGMLSLSGMQLAAEPRIEREINLQAFDDESLLVAFLSELLYLGELHHLGFDQYEIQVERQQLSAQLTGAPIQSIEKEIKAVTFHRLVIHTDAHGLSTRLVFDV